MMEFSRPSTHHRLNSTVYEIVHLDFNGSVTIPGEWDPYQTLEYLEYRMKTPLIPTMNDAGSEFHVRDKFVVFKPFEVIITSIPQYNEDNVIIFSSY
jgi:hypothetical protein